MPAPVNGNAGVILADAGRRNKGGSGLAGTGEVYDPREALGTTIH